MGKLVVLLAAQVETVQFQKKLHLIHILVGLVMETKVDPVLVSLPHLVATARTLQLISLILQLALAAAVVGQAQLVLMHHQSSVENPQRSSAVAEVVQFT
jgi:hypothetical protein